MVVLVPAIGPVVVVVVDIVPVILGLCVVPESVLVPTMLEKLEVTDEEVVVVEDVVTVVEEVLKIVGVVTVTTTLLTCWPTGVDTG